MIKHRYIYAYLMVLVLQCMLAEARANPVRVSPEQPTAGSTLTISYNTTDKGSVFNHTVTGLDLYVLVWESDAKPSFRKYPMWKENGLWKVSFQAKEPALFIQYKFVSGEQEDNLNGQFGEVRLYGENGSPVKGVGIASGKSWIYRMLMPSWVERAEMIRDQNISKGADLFLEEYHHHQGNTKAAYWYIRCLRWQMRPGDSQQALIQEAINLAESVFENLPEDPYAMASIAFVHQQFGNRIKGDEMASALVTSWPDHPVSETFRAEWVVYPPQGSSHINRLNAAIDFMNDFPHTEKSIVMDVLLPSFVALDQFREAKAWINGFENPTAEMYQYLAMKMLDRGYNQFEAIKSMQQAIDVWEAKPGGYKPTYLTDREWAAKPYTKSRKLEAIALYLDYARALLEVDCNEEAIKAAQRAYDLDKGSDLNVITRYVDVLQQAGKPQEALETGLTTILSDNWNPALIDVLEKAYEKLHQTTEGFHTLIEEHKSIALDNRYVLRMIDEYAPDFTLLSHSGDSINLRDLTGKIVVLDFWALWCGPCMRVFPHFQRAAEYFSANPDVVFLAINTMERVEGNERFARVDAFLKENQYTFEVLYDKNRRDVANKYEIAAIPTRITIGRDNRIKYRDRGSGGDTLTESMISQIELLLNEE